MKVAVVLFAVCAVGALAGDGEWKRAKIHERMENHSACDGEDCGAAPEHRAKDGSVVIHPKGESGYNATGEYTGQNTPKEEAPEKVCCHVCPKKCGQSGSKCFHKCYKVCGDVCKVEAHDGECEIGKDCEMVEKKDDGCAVPAATGGVQGDIVDVSAPETVPHEGHASSHVIERASTGTEGVVCGAGTGVPCEEPEVITDEDIETIDADDEEANRKGDEQGNLRASA